MRRNIPSTQALACFEVAARHESYTRAAQELSLTQSAVSRQIIALEEFLGVALFRRTRHGVVLTPAGAHYGRQVSRWLQAVEQGTLDMMAHQGEGGTLSLAAVPTFATRWLIPRLPRLAQQHPDIVVHIETQTRPFLFADTTFDAALYAGTPDQVANWPGIQAQWLMNEDVVPVCSPRVLEAAARNRAKIADGVAEAAKAEVDAVERATVAQRAYAVAAGATQRSSIALQAVMGRIGAAWTGTIAALGGPLGASLAAASAALAIYEIQTFKANMAAEEYKRTLDTLADSLKKVDAAIKGGTVDKALQAEVAGVQGKLKAGLATTSGNFVGELSTSIGLFGPLKGYYNEILTLYGALTRLPDGTIVADKALDALLDRLNQISATDIEIANKITPLRTLGQAVKEEFGKVRDYMAQTTQVLVADPRDLREAASKRFAASLDAMVQAQLRLPSATSDEATLETQDPILRQIRALGIIRQRAVEQGYTEIEAKIQAEEAKLRAALEKGGVSATGTEIRAAAEAAVAASLKQTYDLTKAVDDAAAALEKLKELSGAGLGAGLETQLANVNILIGQMTSSVNEKAVEIGETFRLLLSNIQWNSTTSAEAVRTLAGEVGKMGAEGKVSEDKVRALISALEGLGSTNPDLSSAIGQILTLARAALTAMGAVNSLKTAIGSVGDKAIENTIQGMVGVPDAAQPPGFVQKQIIDAAIAKAGQKGKSRRDRALDLQDQYPGVFTLSDALAAADKIAAAEESKKGGKGKKSDEQKFTEKLERLVETGKASFFTESDRALIQKLEELKADPNLIKATNAAIKAGRPIPDQARQVQDALELKKAGDAYNEIIQKYGTMEQLAPRIAEKQRILNLAIEKGGLTAEQAKLAFADYLGQFQQYKWIDQISSAVGDLAGAFLDVADGTTTAEDAIKRFSKRIAQIAIDTLITEPLKNSMKGFLAELAAGTNNGGGGGGLGSLLGIFGGLFGGGNPGLINAGGGMYLYHRGGLVGTEGIPRYHTGLRTNEFLSVLEKGEQVLTGQQSRRNADLVNGLANMAGGAGRGDIVINNYSGAEVSTRQTDRGTEVDIGALVDAQIMRSANGGALGRHLSSLGLNRFNGR